MKKKLKEIPYNKAKTLFKNGEYIYLESSIIKSQKCMIHTNGENNFDDIFQNFWKINCKENELDFVKFSILI